MGALLTEPVSPYSDHHERQLAQDALDLDREIEYAFDTDEPMLGTPPAGDVE
jgi:hypothetical protein